MIRLTSVSKSFDQKLVLDNINWTVNKGSVFGLVGPNGAGKSTLLRLISGVLQADNGQVEVDEQLVYDQPSVKRRILFLADEPFFLHQTTLKEMKEFYKIFYPAFDEKVYAKLLTNFPIAENEKINTFSKGMKRQAGLILALSVSPDVLLLDEAFDGLDPVMRLTLKRFISNEILNREMTVVISSHNLRELEDICDQIALIDQRKVVMSGDVDKIKGDFHKFQVGFNTEVAEDLFEDLLPIHLDRHGKVFTIVVKGDPEALVAKINQLNPVLVNELPLNLEEIFVYEMEGRGYGKSV